jgi:L-iditol 2-dehydrogenase
MKNVMKAAVFEGIENLQIREVPKPGCDPDGVIVKVESCGLCGSDIRNFHAGLRHGVERQIMGHEIAGVVEETGPQTARLKTGDRVAVAPDVSCGTCYYCRRGWVNLCVNHRMVGTHWPGGFAQYLHLPGVVLERGMVHPMPRNLSFDHAALSEPLSSVLASQQNSGVGLGDTVLVIGDGPVGCMHLQVARARGASCVIMVGLMRLGVVKVFEPDHLIDAASQNPVDEVFKITGGLGADVAVIANPVAKTQEQGLESVRKRGTVILFGGVPKSDPMTTLNSNLIHYNEIRVVGAFSYPAVMHEKALQVLAERRITPEKYITRTVGLDGIVGAIKAAETGVELKVVVKPWQ